MSEIIRLASLDDPRLDVFARLTDHQLRARVEGERGLLVCESPIAVAVALDAGVEPVSFLLDEGRVETCAALLRRAGDEVTALVLPRDEMSRLTGYHVTRGFLCAMRRPAPRTPDEVLGGARNVVVLEDLVDTSNVGALVRSAAALGADAVLLSPRCCDPLCRRSVRVSMGTVFMVPWARVDDATWPRVCDLLRSHGLTCLAMALEPDAVPIDDPSLAGLGPRALFFGTEGTGLSRGVLDACDRSVIIPMSRGVDSLNVAASSAVAFWQLFR